VSLGKLRQKRDRSGLKIRDLRRPTESGSPPALRTFLAIADLWGLMEEHRLLVLGYPSRSTYHNWCKQAREHGAFTLNVDVLARISALLGIHQALGILFPTERLGAEWLRTAHNAVFFGGRPPLDLVSSGSQDGLLSVRHFLDGARGGHYMRPNAIYEASTPYTATRKSSSGDGHFRTGAAAYLPPDPHAISTHRTVRYGCDDSRSFGGNGTRRLDERSGRGGEDRSAAAKRMGAWCPQR
jgi:hypothetical protein